MYNSGQPADFVNMLSFQVLLSPLLSVQAYTSKDPTGQLTVFVLSVQMAVWPDDTEEE